MIELAAGIIMAVSGLTNTTGVPEALDTIIKESQVKKVAVEDEMHSEPSTLEAYVREHFAKTPVMAEIARCESHFRHLDKNGKILRGTMTPEDVGVMQINEFFHAETAKKLGFDLHDIDGNMAFAQYLYDKSGTQPWSASKSCWSKTSNLAKN